MGNWYPYDPNELECICNARAPWQECGSGAVRILCPYPEPWSVRKVGSEKTAVDQNIKIGQITLRKVITYMTYRDQGVIKLSKGEHKCPFKFQILLRAPVLKSRSRQILPGAGTVREFHSEPESGPKPTEICTAPHLCPVFMTSYLIVCLV